MSVAKGALPTRTDTAEMVMKAQVGDWAGTLDYRKAGTLASVDGNIELSYTCGKSQCPFLPPSAHLISNIGRDIGSIRNTGKAPSQK